MSSPGRRYASIAQRACAASAPQTVLGVTTGGTNLKRPSWYDAILGSAASPADNAILWEAQRYTAAGTGATTTAPQALDSADSSSDSSGVQANTVDPTFTANAILLYIALNQRATHRWIADTYGALVTPATANNGIGLWATNASFTGNINATVHFFE